MLVRGTALIMSPPSKIWNWSSSAVTVTVLRAWIMPTWIFWVATMMLPRRRNAPLDGDRPSGLGRDGAGAAGTAQRGPLIGRDGAGHGAHQCPGLAGGGHLGALHARGNLPGELVADTELVTGDTGQAAPVDQAIDLDRGAIAGRQRGGPARRAPLAERRPVSVMPSRDDKVLIGIPPARAGRSGQPRW